MDEAPTPTAPSRGASEEVWQAKLLAHWGESENTNGWKLLTGKNNGDSLDIESDDAKAKLGAWKWSTEHNEWALDNGVEERSRLRMDFLFSRAVKIDKTDATEYLVVEVKVARLHEGAYGYKASETYGAIQTEKEKKVDDASQKWALQIPNGRGDYLCTSLDIQKWRARNQARCYATILRTQLGSPCVQYMTIIGVDKGGDDQSSTISSTLRRPSSGILGRFYADNKRSNAFDLRIQLIQSKSVDTSAIGVDKLAAQLQVVYLFEDDE
ncbi:uncharacterized protein MONBRDRAFT_32706 [Monosiga brevicollis MX1]|uniref:Uncharacterized protein n=1 Tax=Monosiga brevicollis TaxID=81824 RepID=A9V174_MONBE|nr:uncharacterized protein MONBRDRAFT_32706 [Monosiga brevicollis MX1]EDQ88760.1 predicted protein [Monosiga brevicollis MX1]|eukprot:XP_001746373.1 hypothetical protein [Monosiga brevicollis MX1]